MFHVTAVLPAGLCHDLRTQLRRCEAAPSRITCLTSACTLIGAVCVTAGALALNGDLPAVVEWVQGSFLVYPARAAIAGPLLYHYVAGLRHLAWDHAK